MFKLARAMVYQVFKLSRVIRVVLMFFHSLKVIPHKQKNLMFGKKMTKMTIYFLIQVGRVLVSYLSFDLTCFPFCKRV